MWECGDTTPDRYYQEKLIELFGKDAEELGFVEAQISPALSSNSSSHLTPPQVVVPGSTAGTIAVDMSLDKQEGRSTYSTPIAAQTSFAPGSGNPESLSLVAAPMGLIRGHQSLDFLHTTIEGTPEQRLGAWLALGASDLA